MAHATGLRLLAMLCFFTIILSPLGAGFWWLARKKEKERERELEALEKMAQESEQG